MTDDEKKRLRERIETLLSNVSVAAEKSGRDSKKIRVVLATKTRSAEEINFALSCGVSEIGENRVQELLEKYDALDRQCCTVHFIGTLQTNKVKYIIDKVDLVHSVNSIKLADEIDKQAKKHGLVKDVLIEVNAADEQSKTGIAEDDLYELLFHASKLSNIRVRGLMAIPPRPKEQKFGVECCADVNNLQKCADSREYFQKIRQLFLDISAKKIDNISMDILSLGMSGDYVEAIEEGSTLIRPGRAVFGERIYLSPNTQSSITK